MSNKHIPVLLQTIIELYKPAPGKRFIDATLGMGGHTYAFADQGAQILALDRDQSAIDEVSRQIQHRTGPKNIFVVKSSFSDIETIGKQRGFDQVDGILFDLGFSSWHLSTSERGFSFMEDEPLDMRFDTQSTPRTAADVLNTSSIQELEHIFARYAELETAHSIAQTIVSHRPVWRTKDLNALIAREHTKGSINTLLARVYQALRINVNDEFTHIEHGVRGAIRLLKPQGILGVISFHSLEDRMIKRLYDVSDELMVPSKKPIVANKEEQRQNTRSRSAKLRIAYKI